MFVINSFAAFGLVSAVIQFYSAVWAPHKGLPQPGRIAWVVGAVAVLYGLARAWPRRHVSVEFKRPNMTVTVTVGDLFAQRNAHLVIGFNDVFDTDAKDGTIISPTSVQGQFLKRVYNDDLDRLNSDLTAALRAVRPVATERRASKPKGKLRRYPIGTVAVLGDPDRRFFCVAYSKMQNNLIAKSTVNNLWKSLDFIWDAVFLQGQRGTVALPIVGSDLARINCLDRESLLRMILLSFVARSREEPLCRELMVVIYPPDYARINMLEVSAFLRTL